MTTLKALLDTIVEDPLAEDRWSVVADWLEEYDDPQRAELLRLHRRLLATCCEPDAHPDRAAWQARLVELLGLGVRPCVAQTTVTLADGVEMTFSFIPPGRFLMGSPEDEEGRLGNELRHRVTLTRGFFLGVHPVTQGQWREVTGRSFRGFRRKGLPVQGVSWDDCIDFCRRLGDKTGWRFRLPTEAEWEYACRCGTTTPFYCGNTLSVDDANYNGEETFGEGRRGISRGEPTPVGNFSPNAFGLHDMAGNMWEWCSDWFGPYQAGESVDPEVRIPGTNGCCVAAPGTEAVSSAGPRTAGTLSQATAAACVWAAVSCCAATDPLACRLGGEAKTARPPLWWSADGVVRWHQDRVMSKTQLERMATGHTSKGESLPRWTFASMHGCGAVCSTPNDLLAFHDAYCGHTETKLRKAMQATQKKRFAAFGGVGTGLGWFVQEVGGKTAWWHNGGTTGFKTCNWFCEKPSVALVILCNTGSDADDDGRDFYRMGEALFRQLVEAGKKAEK